MVADIDAAQDRLGFDNRTAVIKFCVKTFIRHLAAHGEAGLPPNWREMMKDLDGRTHRYKKLQKIVINGHGNRVTVAEDGVPYGTKKRKARKP